MNKYIFVFFIWHSYLIYGKDYTEYNNLTTTAKKYYVAKRYTEANYIFTAAYDNNEDIYRSIDLYYWGATLAYLNKKEEAYQKIILAQKRQNDCWSIEYKVKNDSIFNFLNEKQKIEISNTKPKNIDFLNADSLIYDSIISLQAYDSYIQDYIEDSLFVYDKGTKQRERIQKHIFDMNREVSKRFYFLMKENKFPESCYLMGLCELFLVHLDSDYWPKFEPILAKNLKNGKITPFIYAYTYFRTHKLDDKYGALQYPEFGGGEPVLVSKNKLTNKASLGLGL